MLSLMPPWIFQFIYSCFIGLLALFTLIVLQPRYVAPIAAT